MGLESIVRITTPTPYIVRVSGVTQTIVNEGSGGGVVPGDYGDIVVGLDGWAIDSTVLSAFGRTLIDDANAAAARTTLELGNVNNTSDANKPVSTATATALGNKVDKVTGYGLSKNDFTDLLKTKLDGLGGATLVDLTEAPWSLVSGGSDNSAKVLAAAVANPGNILFLPSGSYNLSSEVLINTRNVTFLGTGPNLCKFTTSTIIPSTLSEPKGMITFEDGTGCQVHGIGFENTAVNASEFTNLWGLGVYLGRWDFNTTGVTIECKNLRFSNLRFTAPNVASCGLKLIAHRSGFGGVIEDVYINDVVCENLGCQGIEVLGESDGTVWYSGIKIHNSRFINLGTVSTYGMGVSFSGYSHSNLVDNCYFNGCRNIALENAGADYTTFSNNTFINLKAGCKPWTVNGSDGVAFQKTGNVLINNKVMDTAPLAPAYQAQTNLFSSGNRAKCAIYSIIDNVDSSRFIGDEFIYTGTTHGLVVSVQAGSTMNVFIGCKFEHTGASGFTYMVQFAGAGTTHNRLLSGCEFKWGAGGGNVMAEGTSAASNSVQEHYVNGSFRFYRQLTTTERDALPSPVLGMHIYNTTTNKINFRTGSAWEAVTSA